MDIFLIIETKSGYKSKIKYCYDTQGHMECICALVLECVCTCVFSSGCNRGGLHSPAMDRPHSMRGRILPIVEMDTSDVFLQVNIL